MRSKEPESSPGPLAGLIPFVLATLAAFTAWRLLSTEDSVLVAVANSAIQVAFLLVIGAVTWFFVERRSRG